MLIEVLRFWWTGPMFEMLVLGSFRDRMFEVLKFWRTDAMFEVQVMGSFRDRMFEVLTFWRTDGMFEVQVLGSFRDWMFEVLTFWRTDAMFEVQVLGSFRDPVAVADFAAGLDVLTVEIEHIDAGAMERVEEQTGVDVEPTPQTLRIIQASSGSGFRVF
jgi:hypothetical protein